MGAHQQINARTQEVMELKCHRCKINEAVYRVDTTLPPTFRVVAQPSWDICVKCMNDLLQWMNPTLKLQS